MTEETDTYVNWQIYYLNQDAQLNWQTSVYTESIAGYEEIFGQDLDGDGSKGISANNLTGVDTDNTGYQLKVSDAGTVHIWDGSNEDTLVTVRDSFGGTPALAISDDYWSDEYGGYSVKPYAVEKDADNLYLAIKTKDSWTEWGSDDSDDFTTHENIEWEIIKLSLEGVIDPDPASTIRTQSIIKWEPIFDQDMNGDGDKSGTVNIVLRDVDVSGARLGDADGQLYIVDGDIEIAVNDPWIEDNSSWTDGSNMSVALAVERNDNGTNRTDDDYYQLAVKQDHKWTDYWTGEVQSDQNWQVYAVSLNGQINWDKTIWTQSIAGFEQFFGSDLNADGVSGINAEGLVNAPLDTYGYRLKKDDRKLLYITDENESTTIPISDEWGGYPSFDSTHNWGSGSSKSSAVAVEQKADGSFALAVRREDTWDGETTNNWEILSVSSEGVLTWDDAEWTEDISLYETTIFKNDLDGDGAEGLNLEDLLSVSTDTLGATLWSDSDQSRYYIKDDDATVGIKNPWGGWIDFSFEDSWADYTHQFEPLAVQSHRFTASNGKIVDGYLLVARHSNTDPNNGTTFDYEIEYVLPSGSVDEELRIHTNSIKGKEALFAQDLDGDGKIGHDWTQLISVETDTIGDSLKKLGEVLYVVDDKNTEDDPSDDVTFEVVDAWGGTPWFDWSQTWGYGDYAQTYASSAFAVESTVDTEGNKNFLLAVKGSNSFGDGESAVYWETYRIKESNPGEGDWYLDWDTGTYSQGARRLEATFNQDMNGNDVVDSGAIATTNVETDTSTSGLTGAALAKDNEDLSISSEAQRLQFSSKMNTVLSRLIGMRLGAPTADQQQHLLWKGSRMITTKSRRINWQFDMKKPIASLM